jgi:phospholipase C
VSERRDQDDPRDDLSGLSNRLFLQGAAALGAAGLAGTLPATPVYAAKRPRRSLETLVICSQENRSFDHYFGFAPWVGSYGVPPG